MDSGETRLRDGRAGGPFKVLRSADVDETRKLVAGVFCEHRLHQVGATERLDYRHEHVHGTAVAFSVMRYGARVVVDPGSLATFFLVQIPLDGFDLVTVDKAEVASHRGCASVHSPHHHLRMCWSADCRKLVVRIDKEELERHAVNLSGRPLKDKLEFALPMDTEQGHGATWSNFAKGMVEQIRRTPAMLQSPLVAAQFEQLLMTSLLEWQPNTHSAALARRAAPDPCPRHVRKAEEYVRANAHLPITLDDLVTIAGVSGSSLHAGFRKHYGMAPIQYLRQVRMKRVRQDLENASIEGSVTSIATRWGFFELGRFAADYRKLFGENPSDTLKRCR